MVRIMSISFISPRPEERALARVSKDGHRSCPWPSFETAALRARPPQDEVRGLDPIVRPDWFHGIDPLGDGTLSTQASRPECSGRDLRFRPRDAARCGLLQTGSLRATEPLEWRSHLLQPVRQISPSWNSRLPGILAFMERSRIRTRLPARWRRMPPRTRVVARVSAS
jgi:hypothetical protein